MSDLIIMMINYFKGDARRVNHFLKVHEFAKVIGEHEALTEKQLLILELASILHDVGIKNGEIKYNRNDGEIQEQEGGIVAESMLRRLGYPDDIIDRVVFLVSNHHSYNLIDNLDFQILVEADFIVNAYEDKCSKQSILSIKNKYFKTKKGKEVLDNLYSLNKKEC